MPITDILIEGYEPVSNDPSGAFFGPRACGENFGALMRQHPTYIDPLSSLAGGYMVNFSSYRTSGWKAEFDFSHLHADQRLYQLHSGIGAGQHFARTWQSVWNWDGAGCWQRFTTTSPFTRMSPISMPGWKLS